MNQERIIEINSNYCIRFMHIFGDNKSFKLKEQRLSSVDLEPELTSALNISYTVHKLPSLEHSSSSFSPYCKLCFVWDHGGTRSDPSVMEYQSPMKETSL